MRGKENLVRWSLYVLFVLVAMSTTTAQTTIPEPSGQSRIIYVDDDAAGFNIGTSWTYAINSLQDALLLAYFYEKPVEIRVAGGIYTPDRGIGIRPGDRTASFQLINGVTIKGGYAGLSRRGSNVRDVNQYKSILSGDLNADDGSGPARERENSYHVVTASGIDATAVLDGFTITGGNAEGPYPYSYDRGGGMYINSSSPTVINCTFSGNFGDSRTDGGAGMYNVDSNPMLVDCVFSENISSGKGGGMYNSSSNPTLLNCIFIRNTTTINGSAMCNYKSSPMLTNCEFIENSGGGGGAMYNSFSSPMLSDCTFRGNSTTGSGGGMCNSVSNTVLLSCIFSENMAQRDGGGMYNSSSNPTLLNCIFNRNSAVSGGGMESIETSKPTLINCTFSANHAISAGGGISSINSTTTKLLNCILWADTPDEIWAVSRAHDAGLTVAITYSNVQGGWQGEGNLDINPLFVDPESGDYHLRSKAGRWDTISQSWIVDQISSPCIDAGDPGMPVGLERFPNGGRINMGAYGGTAEASLSPQQLQFLLGRATNPNPANEANNISRNVTLSWTAGLNAVWHDVYFGPSTNEMVIVSSHQATTEFKLETLEYGTTYYWCIDEVDSEGHIRIGDVWTFTTGVPSRR